jgi:ribonucleoside-diphosphate reductase alpha chain
VKDSTSELAERLRREVGLSRRTSKKLAPALENAMYRAVRVKLPPERESITHKFSVGGHEGYITVGMYPDGRPAEVFLKFSTEGSELAGFADAYATSISLSLQYGLPLKVFVDKMINTRFEPCGITTNPNIRIVTSVLDYVGRWLGGRFISSDYLKLPPVPPSASSPPQKKRRKKVLIQPPGPEQPIKGPAEIEKGIKQE